jgi:hypothetical protein
MVVETTEIDNAFDELKDSLPDSASWVNSFFKGAGKFSALLQGDQNFKLDRRAKRFTSTNPVWIRFIRFTTDDAATLKKQLTCTALTLSGKEVEKKLTLDAKGSFAYVWFNELITSFEIKSDGLINRPSLSKININGFDLTTFEKVAEKVSDVLEIKRTIDEVLEKAKTEVKTAQEQYEAEQVRINEIKIECDAVDEKLVELREIKEGLDNDISASRILASSIEASNQQANASLESARNNVQQLLEQSKDLNERVRREKSQLESITNDKSLISDEYKDYVKEGRSQAFLYVILSFLPLLAIAFAVNKLFTGAEELLLREYKGYMDIFAGLLLRIPFSVVLGLGMYYSWILAANLFSSIFKIHKDRLVLARLLVIAKDTVFSSAQGLDVSDEIKFQERIRLKIELLKSHLSKELSSDFKYGRKVDLPLPHSSDDHDVSDSETDQNSPPTSLGKK